MVILYFWVNLRSRLHDRTEKSRGQSVKLKTFWRVKISGYSIFGKFTWTLKPCSKMKTKARLQILCFYLTSRSLVHDRTEKSRGQSVKSKTFWRVKISGYSIFGWESMGPWHGLTGYLYSDLVARPKMAESSWKGWSVTKAIKIHH